MPYVLITLIFLPKIHRVRHEAEESERGLKERISKLEHQRIDLEEEVSRFRNQITAEKLAGEEHLLMAKQKIKNEEVSSKYFLRDVFECITLNKFNPAYIIGV